MELKRVDIYKLLNANGFMPHLQGYEYIADAIELCNEDKSNLELVTKGLYPMIAKKNNVTASKVERGIRFSIERAYLSEGYEFATRFNRKPKNSEAIAVLLQAIQYGI